jgi:hypothetical protein
MDLWTSKDGKKRWAMITRAPVLTLWAAVVAEALRFEHGGALILGRVAVSHLESHGAGSGAHARLRGHQPGP